LTTSQICHDTKSGLACSQCRHPPAGLPTSRFNISTVKQPGLSAIHHQNSTSSWPHHEIIQGCQRMFNSSLRRVARSCPNGSLSPLRPSSPGHTIAVAATFTTHSHQRRNSSSKPPTPPNNGHPPIPTASVKQVGAPRSTTDKRPGTESRLAKRKSAKGEKVEVKTNAKKEDTEVYSNEWTSSLPSVPSTQHLNPKGKDIPHPTHDWQLIRLRRRLCSILLQHPPPNIYYRTLTTRDLNIRH